MASITRTAVDERQRADQMAGTTFATETLLYADRCPNLTLVTDWLRAALLDSRVARPRFTWRAVHNHRAAGGAGSPTLPINGTDPFPKPPTAAGLCCRLYRTEDGLSGAPSINQLVATLRPHLTVP